MKNITIELSLKWCDIKQHARNTIAKKFKLIEPFVLNITTPPATISPDDLNMNVYRGSNWYDNNRLTNGTYTTSTTTAA